MNFYDEEMNYNAALYIRLSKEDGDKDESESVVNQRKILRRFAKENNYKVYDEYIDDGYSGTNFERPDFKRLILDIEKNKVNMVITKTLSRLGRDYIETGRYIENYFPEKNVRYIAVLDDIDTYLDKNCETVPFRNVMNDFYARETSKNIKNTKNRKRKEGFYYTTYAPFGYTKIDKSGKMKINEPQAEIVRKIFDLFIEGKGTYQIANYLTEHNIKKPGIQMEMTSALSKGKSKDTNKWNHNTVRRILENQSYIGDTVQNKRKKISYKSKKIIEMPKENYTITKNHHEPIISKEKWELVQKILEKTKNTKRKKTDVLFKDLLYCAYCNKKLQIRSRTEHNKSGEVVRRYIYSNKTKTIADERCLKKYIRYDEFEKKAIDKIISVIKIYLKSNEYKNDEVLRKILESQSNRTKIENTIDKINNDIEKINKQIRMLYQDKLNNIIEEQDYIFFSGNLLTKRENLMKSLNTRKKELESYNEKSNKNKIKRQMKEKLKSIVEDKKIDKEVLMQLVDRIEIDNDNNATIFFNFYELNCLGGEMYNEKSAV